MPRRKKNGQSPARVPGGPPEGGSLGHNPGFDGAMANKFPSSTSLSSSDKEKTVKSMQEMFPHLDPEVIYIVLSECDFKVENAMDSFCELSEAAEDAVPIPSPVSGFERTAAALLSPCHLSEPRPDQDFSKPSALSSSPPYTNLLTAELDLLVDQELEILTTQQSVKEEHQGCQYLSIGTSLSSFPPPPIPQQVLPELLQSSLQSGSRGPPGVGPEEHISGSSSPLNQLSTWKDEAVDEQQQSLVNFTHTETPADKPKPPLDLAASGRPSAFQVYKKQDASHTPSEEAGVMPSRAIVGGARSKVMNQELFGYMPSSWNLQAPAFSPRVHGNQQPAFITPVAQTPSNWPGLPRHVSPWLIQNPISQAPLKPSATIPKSWALPAAPHPPPQHSRLRLQGKVLVMLRGAPGSGKSTLARALLEYNPGGVKLSTDDYFTRHGVYQFDPAALGEAHEWNHKRAKEAFERGSNPIIIDNTNLQGWEMKPYVAQALKHGYKVLFREPDTWWKNKPKELERRTTHHVPVEKIRRMLESYERYVTVQSIMGSQLPEMKQRLPLEDRNSKLVSSETPCPDLVGQPGLSEGAKKSHPQLYSSLPDVSSIGQSNEVGMLEDGTHKSTESLTFQPAGTLTENPEMSDGDEDLDFGELDSELDAQLELNYPIEDQRMPDCIVESVMSEDHRCDERPVAFSESIAQRVRRERPSRRSGFDRSEPADLVKDTNQSDTEAKEQEKTEEAEGGEMRREEEKGMPKMLDFTGDWPCEEIMEQRQMKRRERHTEGTRKEDEGASTETDKKKRKELQGPNVTEFQKLLDLIQTGVADIQTSSSHSPSLSPSSGEELEREEEEAGGRFEESHGSGWNSDEREQNTNRVHSSRGELPDCVLDWKAADSCKVRESIVDDWEELDTENEISSRGGNVLDIGKETVSEGFKSTSPSNPPSTPAADTLVVSEIMEANVCYDEEGRHNIEGKVGTEPTACHTDADRNNCTDSSRETRVEADSSEACLSPVCGSSVESDSGAFSGGSQDRKQRQGRRSGKQCKLALTFTQNCPAASPNTPEYPNTAAQSINSPQNSINTDVFNLDSSTLSPKPNLFTDSRSEAQLQPPSPSPLVASGSTTQTEPQDFALLWRLNYQDGADDAGVTTCSHPSDFTVLSGDSFRFMPELSSAVSAAVAVDPSGHREIPYRVVHEKGTQVEEKELGAIQDRLESLRILSRHFKLVSFDTLEDLYDKCHQDLEWTTNLLLDSGERFFRDDDGEKDEGDGAGDEDESVETNVSDEHHLALPKKEPLGSNEVINTLTSGAVTEYGPINTDPTDTTSSPEAELSPASAVNEGKSCDEHIVTSEADQGGGGACGRSLDDGLIIEEEIASMDEVHRLLQAELEEIEREQKQKEEEKRTERRHMEERRSRHPDIQSLELRLPTELALQLTELFGPVGVDPGTCSPDDYAVQMDLNLAKLIHQTWKETIQERQRQATLSFHLLQESSAHWGESRAARSGSREMPFMDHWNASRPHVSLRDIIKEEQALQENVTKMRQSRADLDRRDGATLLKENQLYSLFPSIDRHFLQDIFRDHNYSLTQTELFLRSLLEEEPVKTVVAPEAPRPNPFRAASKEREKRQKPPESTVPDYQDPEDPEYEDFRAEASQQRSRQLECFSKAAEAFKQGRKEVASFYAQQGHLHGQRMREANHRAAVQIFKRVNSSLLPNNILDLHGLHVNEALEHLAQVLQDKTTACEQGLCRPQLSVITGRGNHSQGGVARIRPAVIDYLTNKHYRFTEPKPGLVLVSLK